MIHKIRINPLTKEQRRRIDANIPKCKCGNNLSRHRQDLGMNHCPACDVVEDECLSLLKELVDLIEDNMKGNYTFDSFSLQPAKTYLNNLYES